MPTDFVAEGLLEGVDEPEARAARLALLERLEAEGVPLEELRTAVREGRLALLPVERMLLGTGAALTRAEVAARSGLDPDLLDALRRALGLALPEPGEAAYDERALDMAAAIKRFVEAGVPAEAILEATRVVGRSAAAMVQAEAEALTGALARPGATELDIATGWASATRELRPLMDWLVTYVLDLNRLELARSEVMAITGAEAPGARWTAVCFTDLVGFTRLGELVPPDELGAVAGRLEELAVDAALAPVRLVKLIGDAAMLVAPDADAVIEAALSLIEAAGAEGDEFPQLRAGVAAGTAVRRAADWYGRPVNLASRLTGVARPGSVLVSEEAREAAAREWSWSFAGRRRVRGVPGEVAMFRVRRPPV